jgi:hypothetical protein
MAVTVSARLSTDVGNGLSFGSDTGLYGAGAQPRGGAIGWTLDNSWGTATGTTYYYYLPTATAPATAFTSGTAILWPLVFSRNAKFGGISQYVSTAGAGSQVYQSAFASDPSTGAPAAKITDIGWGNGAATGPQAFTMLDNTTTFYANTLYWMCTWAYTTSAMPSINMRNIGQLTSIRLPAAPTSASYFSSTGVISLLDTSVTWNTRTTAPSTVAPAAISASAPGSNVSAPHFALGIANA